jgi:uncharacterized membrane protein required for colicin V production
MDALAIDIAGSDWPWIDVLGVALVVGLGALGFARGLWWQVFRLVGLAAAVLAARSLAPACERQLLAALPELDPRLGHGIAWVAVFLAGLGLAALAGMLGKHSLEALQLGLLDRVGGCVAGLLTALVLQAVLVLCALQFQGLAFCREHVARSRSAALARVLIDEWPLLVRGERGRELAGRLE